MPLCVCLLFPFQYYNHFVTNITCRAVPWLWHWTLSNHWITSHSRKSLSQVSLALHSIFNLLQWENESAFFDWLSLMTCHSSRWPVNLIWLQFVFCFVFNMLSCRYTSTSCPHMIIHYFMYDPWKKNINVFIRWQFFFLCLQFIFKNQWWASFEWRCIDVLQKAFKIGKNYIFVLKKFMIFEFKSLFVGWIINQKRFSITAIISASADTLAVIELQLKMNLNIF